MDKKLVTGNKSAPSLQDLVLNDVHLICDQLYQLHRNVPDLKSLMLIFSYILYDEDDEGITHNFTQPTVVNQLKSFQLEIDDSNELHDTFLLEGLRTSIIRHPNYIHESYCKLTTLILFSEPWLGDASFVRNIPVDFDRVQQLMTKIVYRLEDLIKTELLSYSEENV